MVSRSWISSFALAWLLCCAEASSQTLSAAEIEERLRQAVELRRASHDREAAELLTEVYRLAPSPRTGAQLGLARQALGQWLDADRLLREALASPQDPWVHRNLGVLETAVAVAARHLGTVELTGGVDGAEVVIEGETVAHLPLAAPLRVLAGTISLVVRAPGYIPLERRFVVDPGTSLREAIELRPEPPPVVAPPVVTPPPQTPVVTPPAPVVPIVAPPVTLPRERDDSARRTRRILGYAGLAVAGAGVAVGVMGVVLQRDEANRFNSECDTSGRIAGCNDIEARANTWSALSWVGFSLGALAAVGATTLLVWPSASGTSQRALRCAPTLQGAGCALTF